MSDAKPIVVTSRRGDTLHVWSKEQVDYWAALGYTGDASAADESTGYEALKVDELKSEIDRRNEGREEADLIPSDGKKADLIAALEADDSK